MGKRAVYNNQYLAIYITQEHFERLIKVGSTTVPVFIGKSNEPLAWINLHLDQLSSDVLEIALDAERQAVQEIQDQFAKDHPDYENSTQVQRRQQHARRKVR